MAYKWMPVVLSEQCTGCGLCVDACGPKSLTMVDGIAVLAFPETCGSEEHCISACRDDAIQMASLPFSGDRSVGKWSENIEQATSAGSRASQLALE
jgi:Na+-translocating ferredoxin:NAD+ oxidoreductase RNF subunit RnfB